MKDPIKPYWGKCRACNRQDLLDVGHTCAMCFGLMDYQEQSAHIAHIKWIKAGRPVDTTDPWEPK